MTFLTILLSLLIEQIRPAPHEWIAHRLKAWANVLGNRLNTGEHCQGLWAWLIAALLPALMVGIVHAFLPLAAAFVLGLVLLWLAGGLRRFSHHYQEIELALRTQDIQAARQHLTRWTGQRSEALSSTEVARLAMEQGIVCAFHGVFALLFWFVIAGPAGIVLWQLTVALRAHWSVVEAKLPGEQALGQIAQKAYDLLAWLPVRLTAMTFALAGDFEDAVHCWRTQATRWPDANEGILLSSAAGALGVRLGLPIPDGDQWFSRPELGLGDDPDADGMLSLRALVWRTLVVGVGALAILTSIYLVGHL
jgi:adenosylcobinamide-phosphate synthase